MIESTYFPPVFWNCLKFKLGPKFLGWGEKPILQNKWIYISVFKTWRMQVLHHLISMHSVFLAIYVVRFQYILCSSFKSNFTAFSSLIYNLLCMMNDNEFGTLKLLKLKYRRGTNSAKRLNYLVPPSVFQF